MPGSVQFTSFTKFMNGLIGVEGEKLDDILGGISEISTALAENNCCTTISLISAQLGTIQSDVDPLSGQLGTIQSDVEILNLITAQLGTIQSDVDPLSAQLGTIQSDVNCICPALDIAQSEYVRMNSTLSEVAGDVERTAEVLEGNILSSLDDINEALDTLATNTIRGRQNQGGKLITVSGATSGANTTITPPTVPGAGESIRVRFVHFCANNGGSYAADLVFQVTNNVGGEPYFRTEWERDASAERHFELGDWYHEITTTDFDIRRVSGSNDIHFNIGYTIQNVEGALP